MITSPIPVFPLGLVLLPGATVPLHLFEPRYRALLADVGDTTRRFGLIAPPEHTAEAELPAGRIGCIALITAKEVLPDGRANIMVTGDERFRFESYVDVGTPYRMAHVGEWADLPDEPLQLSTAANRLQTLASRVISASMTTRDIVGGMPELTSDPAALSFQIAHMMDSSTAVLYELLAERSPMERLLGLERVLGDRLATIEAGAELHTRAKTNGHHHGPPPA